ncbi:MAG TPA: carboxypeptidase-like regulatory domain-containing protein, partial [Cyclobacteriaceae bacterium]|nr:carboxypeptidase-like regulatory domain-containing protein [Cyclobacteriaceae bacterium]
MKYPTLASILLVFMCLVSEAQETNQRITGEFTSLRFNEFVDAIERQSDYRFFFDVSRLDSLIVNLQVTRKPLNEILHEVLKGTDLTFSIDKNNYVYINARSPILTELPTHFFSKDLNADETADVNNSRFAEAEKIKTEKVIIIGTRGTNTRATATLAGFIRNSKSGESLIGATIMIEKPVTGSITDGNGYYSITLPKGSHQLKINNLGMKSIEKSVIIHSDGRLNIDMDEDILPLKEVIVEAKRDESVMGLQMGLEKFDFKAMKQLPIALG